MAPQALPESESSSRLPPLTPNPSKLHHKLSLSITFLFIAVLFFFPFLLLVLRFLLGRERKDQSEQLLRRNGTFCSGREAQLERKGFLERDCSPNANPAPPLISRVSGVVGQVTKLLWLFSAGTRAPCRLSSGIVTRNKRSRSTRPITSLLQHQERMVLFPSILILIQNRFSTDVGKRELTRRDPLYLQPS